jgi:hypothetical protein
VAEFAIEIQEPGRHNTWNAEHSLNIRFVPIGEAGAPFARCNDQDDQIVVRHRMTSRPNSGLFDRCPANE